MKSIEQTETAKVGLLIEIDAVLDTRLATVRKLYPDVAIDLERNVAYRTRKTDELHLIDPRIDAVEYQMAYLKRDNDTLDLAKRSMVSSYITQLITKLQWVIDGNNPYLRDIDVIINLHPYTLTEDESRLIAAGLGAALGLGGDVRYINKPPQEITLDYLSGQGIFTYLLYDWNAWVSVALPDKEGSTLQTLGLNRVENLTIIGAKLALDLKKSLEVERLFKEADIPMHLDDVSSLPWALLFDQHLLDPVFFTEYDEQIAEKIMSVINKSNNPIDVEVTLIADYYTLIQELESKEARVAKLIEASKRVAKELEIAFAQSEVELNKVRSLLAEQRFITDSLSVFIPSQPALDFERFVDSKMSWFDTSYENSEVSEYHWNNLGVKCRRIIRDAPFLSSSAYILVCAEATTDSNGVYHEKNAILNSTMAFEPILEQVGIEELEAFKQEFCT